MLSVTFHPTGISFDSDVLSPIITSRWTIFEAVSDDNNRFVQLKFPVNLQMDPFIF